MLYPDLMFTNPEIVPAPLSSDNRFLMIRRKFVHDLVTLDDHSFEDLTQQYMNVQVIISEVLRSMVVDGTPIKEWFIKYTDESDWISAFRNYELFDIYTPAKTWDKKKLRIAKNIYNAVSIALIISLPFGWEEPSVNVIPPEEPTLRGITSRKERPG